MKKFIKELIPYLIILIVVVIIRTFIITPVTVSGSSMSPTLKNKELFWNKVKMVLLCWTLFYPLVRYFTNKTLKNEIQVATVRAESLSKEITKLQTALAKRGTQAFI